MSDLTITCLDVVPDKYGASPTLMFKLRITDATGTPIHAIQLRTQIRIEPVRRHYTPEEADRLLDLFGETSRWGDTLKPLQFAALSTLVKPFTGTVDVDLPVPCSYDFEVAEGKYLHALETGEVPFLLLFSGTVFERAGQDGTNFRVNQIPWELESQIRMPAPRWREMMDMYFPGQAWIRMSRETLDAIQHYKSTHALPTWDVAIEHLLTAAREPA